MLAFTIGVVLFALGIGVSIALHEAGHMVTAKAFGMKVRRYFIGFGPKLFSFRRGETEYGLKLIPAGGFCDIAGMTALDEVTPEEEPRAMWRFPVWKRVTVLSAGSITHFILGFIVLYLMALVIGLPNNAEKPVVDSVGCVSNWVIKGTTVTQPACSATDPTPAKDAGFQSGDLVVSINGQATPTFEVVKSITQKLHGPATFMVERDGKQIPLTVNIATARQIPASEANSNTTTPTLAPVGAIGVSMAPYLHYGPVAALGLYEMSRRREMIGPRAPRWRDGFELMGSAVFGRVLVLALMLIAIFIALGRVLPDAKPNFWFGIRTPWTLTNPRVWERTHRVAGYLMVVAGVLGIGAAFLRFEFAVLALAVLGITASVIPLVYSYFAWKQETSR